MFFIFKHSSCVVHYNVYNAHITTLKFVIPSCLFYVSPLGPDDFLGTFLNYFILCFPWEWEINLHIHLNSRQRHVYSLVARFINVTQNKKNFFCIFYVFLVSPIFAARPKTNAWLGRNLVDRVIWTSVGAIHVVTTRNINITFICRELYKSKHPAVFLFFPSLNEWNKNIASRDWH